MFTNVADTRHLDTRLARVAVVATGVTLVALGLLILYGVRSTSERALSAATGAALVAFGAVAVGALVGFLFGVPVSAVAVAEAQAQETRPGGSTMASKAGAGTRGPNQLVQVAEWLTRILIGATLTQLGSLRDQLEELGARASQQILGGPQGEVVMTAAIVYGAVFGFFVGHLSTRLILNLLFEVADGRGELPAAAARDVLAAARAPDGRLTGISPTVASAVLAVDDAKLTSSEDLQAWGLARLATDRDDPTATAQGLAALERAVVARPGDRAAVESLVLGALYSPAPDGFRRALREIEAHLARRATLGRDDAGLLAYRACAHGQAYAWSKQRGDTEGQQTHARAAADAVAATLAVDPSWRPFLLRLTRPGGADDDLATLADDLPELRTLLAG